MKINVGAVLAIGSAIHQIYHAVTGKECKVSIKRADGSITVTPKPKGETSKA